MNFFSPKNQFAAELQAGSCPPTQKMAIGRRGFLTTSAAAMGGLLIGVSRIPSARAATTATVNVFVVIGSDNSITMITPGAEMGQGSMTSAPQLVAEELEADWKKVKIEYALANEQVRRKRVWGDMSAVGSRTIRNSQEYLRKAGATEIGRAHV